VGNLPYDTTETQLRDFFRVMGSVSNVHIVHDDQTHKPKGFAVVIYHDSAAAASAARDLNGHEYHGRTLRVEMSDFQSAGLMMLTPAQIETLPPVARGEINAQRQAIEARLGLKRSRDAEDDLALPPATKKRRVADTDARAKAIAAVKKDIIAAVKVAKEDYVKWRLQFEPTASEIEDLQAWARSAGYVLHYKRKVDGDETQHWIKVYW